MTYSAISARALTPRAVLPRFGGDVQREQAPDPSKGPEDNREYLPWESKPDVQGAYDRLTGKDSQEAVSPAEQRAREQAHRIRKAQENAALAKKLQPRREAALKAMPRLQELADSLAANTTRRELAALQKRLSDEKIPAVLTRQILLRVDELDEVLGRLEDQRTGKCKVSLTPLERELSAKLGLKGNLTAREKQGVIRRLLENLGIDETAPDEAKREIVMIYHQQDPDYVAGHLKTAMPLPTRLVMLRKPFQELNAAEQSELRKLDHEYRISLLEGETNDQEERGRPERAMHPGFSHQYETGKKIQYTKVENAQQLIEMLLDRIPWDLEVERQGAYDYSVKPSNDEDECYEIVFEERPEVLKKGLLNRNGYREAPEDEVWQKYVFPLHEADAIAVAPKDSDLPVRWFRYEKKGGRHRIWWEQKGPNGRPEHYSFQWRSVRSPLKYMDKGKNHEKNRIYYVLERLNKMLYQYAEKGLNDNPRDNQYWQESAYRKGSEELEEHNIEFPEEGKDS